MIKQIRIAAVICGLVMLSGCRLYYWVWWGGEDEYPVVSYAKMAEHRRAAGKLDEALELYRKHLQQRLEDTARPAEENPYFYELLIGDVQLQQGKAEDARAAYEEAKTHQVGKDLVIDRFRRLGAWYEAAGRYEEAIAILKSYRSLDEFLFDIDIDRVAKEALNKELESEAGNQDAAQ
jgi:tetratricopeptide (TPR) repeat protein